MLVQGNVIETKIKGASDLATDFKGAFCVAHDSKVSLLRADGSVSSCIECGSKVLGVRWDGTAFQALTCERFIWLSGGKCVLEARRSKPYEEMVRTGAGRLVWRRRFYGYEFRFVGNDGTVVSEHWTFRPVSTPSLTGGRGVGARMVLSVPDRDQLDVREARARPLRRRFPVRSRVDRRARHADRGQAPIDVGELPRTSRPTSGLTPEPIATQYVMGLPWGAGLAASGL